MSSEFDFDCPTHYFELSQPSLDLYFDQSTDDLWFRTAHPLHEKPTALDVVSEVPKKTPTKRKTVLGTAARRESISKKVETGDVKPVSVFLPVETAFEHRSSSSGEKKEKKRPSSQTVNENTDTNSVATSSIGENKSSEIKTLVAPVIKKKSVAIVPVSSSSSIIEAKSKVEAASTKKSKTVAALTNKSKFGPKPVAARAPSTRSQPTPTSMTETVLYSVREVREWEKITGRSFSPFLRVVRYYMSGLVWAHLKTEDKERANSDMCRMKALNYVPRV